LQYKKTAARASRPASSFVNYRNKRDAIRKASGLDMNRAEYDQWLAQVVIDYGHLSAAELALERVEAEQSFDSKVIAEEDQDEIVGALPSVLRTFVSDIGSKSAPFPPEVFGRIVRGIATEHLGRDPAGRDPGLSAYSGILRDKAGSQIFVDDVGDVPEHKEFSYTLPCTLAHPGLCATKDAELLARLGYKGVSKELHSGICKIACGTFFAAEFTSISVKDEFASDTVTRLAWFGLSHVRGSGPRVMMVSSAKRTDNIVELTFPDQCCDDMQAITFLAREWRRLACHEVMIRVRVLAAPIDPGKECGSPAQVVLCDEWESKFLTGASDLAVVVFPPQAKAKASARPVASEAARALRSLFSDDRRRKRARARKGVVLLKRPKPVARKNPDILAGKEPQQDAAAAATQDPKDVSDDSVVVSSGGSRESEEDSSMDDLDTSQAHRQKVDNWALVPHDGPKMPRLGGRRGRDDLDLVHEGVLMNRIFCTNKHTGVESLSGYSAWCGCGLNGEHPDTTRP